MADARTVLDEAEQQARLAREQSIQRSLDLAVTDAVAVVTHELEQVNQALAQAQATISEQQERIAELQARLDEFENQPEPPLTLFGSCPANPGGESLSAALSVSAKYGPGVAVRQFKENHFNPPSVHEDFSLVHTSYKRSISAVASGQVDDEIRALAEATPEGHVLEIWHESDKKVRDGLYSFEVCVAAKNRFYDVVKATKPGVLVATTYTGYQAEPNNPRFEELWRWGAVKADVLGLDLDGIHSWPYPNYDSEIEVAHEFIERFADNGYLYWSVPEFGTGRNADRDPDGLVRAQWMLDYGRKFREAGALYVCAFEFNFAPNLNELTEAAEIAAWTSLVQS